MKNKNPNCDNDYCREAQSQVRVLPIAPHEIRFRIERNKELEKACQYDLPAWEDLRLYDPT